MRLARQLLAKHFLRTRHARQISRSIERDLHRSSLTLYRRVERLANPPHGVADEVHADVRIVFIGRAHESRVRLAHEIAERDAAILVLLRYRKRETEVGSNQLRPGVFTDVVRLSSAHLSRELLLLERSEHRLTSQLLDIEIK